MGGSRIGGMTVSKLLLFWTRDPRSGAGGRCSQIRQYNGTDFEALNITDGEPTNG